jgi:hypothetical protein
VRSDGIPFSYSRHAIAGGMKFSDTSFVRCRLGKIAHMNVKYPSHPPPDDVSSFSLFPQELDKAGVYGYVDDELTSESVLANNPDGGTDAGQFAIVPSISTTDKYIEFEFIAAVPMEKDVSQFENGIGPLRFKSLRVISFPGGQREFFFFVRLFVRSSSFVRDAFVRDEFFSFSGRLVSSYARFAPPFRNATEGEGPTPVHHIAPLSLGCAHTSSRRAALPAKKNARIRRD